MSDREAMLTRIRAAARAGGTEAPDIPRAYARAGTLPLEEVIELLVDRLVDYRAEVVRCGAVQLEATVARLVGRAGSVAVPPGLSDAALAGCRSGAATVLVDGEPTVLGSAELDRVDVVLTEAAVAVAVTGTIILDGGPGQGRRILSLVPDRHIVILTGDRIVETVPEGIGRLDPTAPLTMISGPSATSDIELQRVEGVHGPRTLQVLIVD